MEQSLEKSIKKGTTTVGIVCSDGIVLAADKRAVAGDLIAIKDVDKIQLVTNNIAVTVAGLVSDAQLVTKLTKAELKIKQIRNMRDPTVKEAANLVGNILYQNIRRMSMVPSIVSFLLGGKDKNGFGLYDLGIDGSVSKVNKFASTGSGSVMAYGVLETLYKDSITVKEAVDLAIKAVNSAIQRSTGSGEGIDVVSITNQGAKRVVKKKIVSELV